MKLTKTKLKQIIKEEFSALEEGSADRPYNAHTHQLLWNCYESSECDDYYNERDVEACKKRCHHYVFTAEKEKPAQSSSRETPSGRKSDFDRWQDDEGSYNYMTRMEESKMKLTKLTLKQIIREELGKVLKEGWFGFGKEDPPVAATDPTDPNTFQKYPWAKPPASKEEQLFRTMVNQEIEAGRSPEEASELVLKDPDFQYLLASMRPEMMGQSVGAIEDKMSRGR
jgi:hypothetical protein